jgi:hypothetical protein
MFGVIQGSKSLQERIRSTQETIKRSPAGNVTHSLQHNSSIEDEKCEYKQNESTRRRKHSFSHH